MNLLAGSGSSAVNPINAAAAASSSQPETLESVVAAAKIGPDPNPTPAPEASAPTPPTPPAPGGPQDDEPEGESRWKALITAPALLLLAILLMGSGLYMHFSDVASKQAADNRTSYQQVVDQRAADQQKSDITTLVVKNLSGNTATFQDIQVTGTATINNLLARLGQIDQLNATNATTETLVVRGATTSGSTNTGSLNVSGNTTLAGLTSNGQVWLTGDSNDVLVIQAQQAGQNLVSLRNASGAEVTSLDSSGNLSLGGNANVAGTLTVPTAHVGDLTANTATIGSLITTGQGVFTATPTGSGVNQGTVYINPASANPGDTLLGLAVGGSEKLRVDASGNFTNAGTLNVAGATTLGSSLNVAGSTVLAGSLQAGFSTLLSLGVTNNTTIGGTLNANGATTLGSTLAVANDTTIGGNLYLAPGKSLYFAGATTFPGSPTEGQVFYRTDTKQLYVYENGKWQADRSSVTLIVAASDTQNKEKADYVGDGTNDQNAINAAIAALPAGGGSVVLLDGTYNLTGSVNISKSNVVLTGSGASTNLKRMWQTVGTPTNLITIGDNTNPYKNIQVSGMRLDGNGSAFTDINNQGVILQANVSYSTIQQLVIAGTTAYHGGISSIGTVSLPNSHLTIQENYFESGMRRIYTTYSTDVNIDGNRNAFHVLNDNSSHIKITRNEIYPDSGFVGILAWNGCSDYQISENTIYGTSWGPGIYNTCDNVTISNNYVTATSWDGIWVMGNNQNVTGNMLVGRGMYVNAAVNATISNNTISSSNGYGIDITTGTNNATVQGNNIIAPTTFGIQIEGNAANNLISNNKISEFGGTAGINDISTGSNNRIVNNDITKTTGTTKAIVISSAVPDLYLSGNTFKGVGAAGIQDSGKNVVYANQANTAGSIITNGQAGVGINTTSPTASLQNTGALVNSAVATPAAPTVAAQGTTGATTWAYRVTAYDGLGETLASTATSIANGNATLSATNYNLITPTRVSGAVSYKIYRTTAGGTPATTGLIGTLAGGATTFAFSDTGLAASTAVPTVNTTGSATIANYLGINNATPANRLAINGVTNSNGSTQAAQALIGTAGTTNLGLVIQGVASQTGDYIQMQDSAGNVTGSLSAATGTSSTALLLANVTANHRLRVVADNNRGYMQTDDSLYFTGVFNATPRVGIEVNASTGNSLFVRAAATQTANLFEVQDTNGNVNAKFGANGNVLTLGRIAASGTVTAGSLVFADGTADNFGATLNTTTLTANRTITLPNESGTICTTGSVCTGYAPASGSGNYIQNGTALQSNANLNIQSAAAASVGAIIRGATSQTANLQEWQNPAGTAVAKVAANGQLTAQGFVTDSAILNSAGAGISLSAGSAMVTITGTGYLSAPTILLSPASGGIQQQASTSQFAGLISSMLTGDANERFAVRTDGYMYWGGGTTGLDVSLMRTSPGVLKFQGLAGSASNTTSTLVVKGLAGQTADLFQIQNSAGTILTAFNSTGQLVFGPSGSQDTNLYRSAADSLKTDDNFTANSLNTPFTVTLGTGTGDTTTLSRLAGGNLGASGGVFATGQLVAANGTAGQVNIGQIGPGSSAALLIGADTNLYRSSANILKTDDGFDAVGSIRGSSFVYAGIGTASQIVMGDVGGQGLARIGFGSAGDTNLYRSTTSTLKTDGALIVGGTNATNSTGAFQVQSTGGANVLNVDTTNSTVSVRGNNSDAVIGSELITITDFTDPSWTSTGWSTTSTTAQHTIGNTSAISTSQFTPVAGATYQITYTVTGNPTAAETVTPGIGNANGRPYSGNGTSIVQVITGVGTQAFKFTPTSNWNGTISNVSIKRVTLSTPTISLANSAGVVTSEARAAGSVRNLFYGAGAGQATLGSALDNAAFGGLQSNTSGAGNAAFGIRSLAYNTTGANNVAVGTDALEFNLTGQANVAVGSAALQNNVTGSSNVAIGGFTLQGNSTSNGNVAIGYTAARYVSGASNIALGTGALGAGSAVTGSNNISIGELSLLNLTSNGSNIAIGVNSGRALTSGSTNTFVGHNSGYLDSNNFATGTTITNATALGNSAQVQTSNALVLGGAGTSAVNVGIGTTIPLNTFSVEPVQYSTGTASRTNSSTTVTGTGTAWTSAMVGSQIIFADGFNGGVITAVGSGTSLTMTNSYTGATDGTPVNYRIHYNGLQVTNTGKVGVGTAAPTASLDVRGDAVFKNVTDSTTALNVQSAGGTSVLNVDTTNSAVSVRGTNSDAVLGPELITNTDFTTAGWTTTNWTTTSTTAAHTTGNTSSLLLNQGVGPTPGASYQVTFTVTGNPTAGETITPTIGAANGIAISGNATNQTQIITALNGAVLRFNPTSNWNGTISNVSYKLLTPASVALKVLNSAGTVALEVRSVDTTAATFVGVGAGQSVTTALYSSAFGSNALQNLTTGQQNTAVGSYALQNTTTGISNTAMGAFSLRNNTTGSSNTGIGTSALAANTTGSQNVSIGGGSMASNTTGNSNASVGLNSLNGNTTGSINSALGNGTLAANTTGNFNTGVGASALGTNTTGTNNTGVGYLSDVLSGNLTASTAIGYNAKVGSSSTIVLGSTAGATKVSVGANYANGTNLLSVGSGTYTTGTIDQTTTAITGTGTTWTPGMTGGTIYYSDGTSGTFTYLTATTGTSSLSKSVTGGTYTIIWGGTNVSTTGATEIQNTADSTSEFTVQSANGTNILNVDSTNSKVSVRGIKSDATVGSELVATNDFTDPSWTTTNWTPTSTTATHTTGNTTPLIYTGFTPVAGTTYQVTFTVTGSPTAGETVTAQIGGNTGSKPLYGNGTTYTVLMYANNTTSLQFVPTSNWNGVISAVSVKVLTASQSALAVQNSSGGTTLEVRATTSNTNTIIGVGGSGSSLTTGFYLTVYGAASLTNNTTGIGNAAFGSNSLQNNTTGSSNTAIGHGTLQGNVNGSSNTAVGSGSLAANISGSNNTALGTSALAANLYGNNNIAIGLNSLYVNTSGGGNTGIGVSALTANTSGSSNVAVGSSALLSNTTGGQNSALGISALSANTIGQLNTAVGSNALGVNGTGSNNTALGYKAGYTATFANANSSGSQNTYIGYLAGPGSATQYNNSTAIGTYSVVSQSDTLILGCTSGVNGCTTTTKVGIGNSAPTNTLGVTGTIGASGSITASTTPDISETISADPDVEPADVVSADPSKTEHARKSQGAYDSTVLGVISDGTSSFKINSHAGAEGADPTGKYLVLAGRVPVKVTNEGGVIHPGDYLTASSTPGKAMKATHAGPTIGKALADFTGTEGSVMIQTSLSYYDPSSGSQVQGQGSDFTDLNASGTATIANLTVTGTANFVDIVVNGHIITGGGQPTALALASGGTATVEGTDTTGTLTITTGATPVAGGLVKVSFSKSYTAAPRVVLSASSDTAADLRIYKDSATTGYVLINSKDAPAPNTTYKFDYFIAQ